MDKPITVARKDFLNDLVDLINKSGLPSFIVSDVMKLTLVQVDDLAEKQYHTDLENWTRPEEPVTGEVIE